VNIYTELLLSSEALLTLNAPNIVWRPGTDRTCWGSLSTSTK